VQFDVGSAVPSIAFNIVQQAMPSLNTHPHFALRPESTPMGDGPSKPTGLQSKVNSMSSMAQSSTQSGLQSGPHGTWIILAPIHKCLLVLVKHQPDSPSRLVAFGVPSTLQLKGFCLKDLILSCSGRVRSSVS
jgi:hypothetical protein